MKSLTALAACLVLAGSVFASPISPTNPRPIDPIGTPTSGEDSVQEILDNGFGNDQYDAIVDQEAAGYFKVAKAISFAIVPQLVLRNDTNLKVGIFSIKNLDDTNSTIHAELFSASASDNDAVMIKWTDNDTVEIGGGSPIDGIERNGFGFYIEDARGNKYYTLDALNGDNAHVLSINNDKDNEWTFFFEAGSDQELDFNEAVLFVESITPVPEPGTLALFGVGAIAAFVIRRRRQS